jgi:hypothetical protein
MSTNINGIKSTIMQRISDDISTVQDVANFEKTNFRGFPAVTLICSGNENDYWSTAENKRQFSFIIRVYQQIEHKVAVIGDLSDTAKEQAENILGTVVSEIIDSFDKYFDLGGSVDYCRAIPSAWGYAQIGEGWARTAEIKIIVIQIFNIEI